jgi:uncharacterized membrane protein
MKVFLRYFLISLSVLIVCILFLASLEKLIKLSLLISAPDGHFPNPEDLHYKDHLILGYLHIIPGMLFLILGAHQIIPYFRNKNFPRHRLIGKVFLLLSALIFITAIVLSIFYPFGDWIETVVSTIFGSFLLYCTYKAYNTARNQQFNAHRNWVTRIYFVAIAVATIRGIIGLFLATTDATLQSIFGISFLLAFILHALLVEIWIRYLAR